MTIGELLKELVERIRALWPMRIVRDWEQGIRIRNGNATALLTSTNGIRGTGLHLYWPVIGEVIVDEVNIRVVETSLQTCTSKDSRDVTFAFAVKYQVRDLRQYYLKIHDYESTVLNEVRSAAGLTVAGLTHAELPERFCAEVEQLVRRRIRGWGIDLVAMGLTNLSAARPIRLIQDQGPQVVVQK